MPRSGAQGAAGGQCVLDDIGVSGHLRLGVGGVLEVDLNAQVGQALQQGLVLQALLQRIGQNRDDSGSTPSPVQKPYQVLKSATPN